MSDALGPLILAGTALLAALLIAGVGHLALRKRAGAVAAAPLDLSGLDGRVLLFSDASCPSCDLARERLGALGAPVREVLYGDDPEAHSVAGVTGVPLIVVRDAGGSEVGRIAGAPGVRRLRGLLRRAGIE